jgi:hypothetical protein
MMNATGQNLISSVHYEPSAQVSKSILLNDYKYQVGENDRDKIIEYEKSITSTVMSILVDNVETMK